MIPLLTARIPPCAKELVGNVLDSGYVGGASDAVIRFERELATFLECDPACLVTTNSGTSALFLAYHLAGVRGGSVATSPMTFVATTTAIYQAGARPYWIDVVPRSCQIGAEGIRPFVQHHCRALVAVAWGGFLPDLRRLRAIADEAGVPLILDAAQAIGAQFGDRPLWIAADFTCYSFAPTKHLTTGDGGAIVCRDPAAADRARRLAWFGMRREVRPPDRWASDQNIPEAGFKLHMNGIAAALGLAGLRDLDATIAACRQNARIYQDRIGSERFYTPDASPWTYTVFVEDVPDFVRYMADRGVVVGQPHRRNDANDFARADRWPLPNTDWAQAHYCSIPIGWWVTESDAERIAGEVRAYPGLLC